MSGFLGNGKYHHGPVLAGSHIAGCTGMADGFSLRGVGARLSRLRKCTNRPEECGGLALDSAPWASKTGESFGMI
jgi:hypothetical protein